MGHPGGAAKKPSTVVRAAGHDPDLAHYRSAGSPRPAISPSTCRATYAIMARLRVAGFLTRPIPKRVALLILLPLCLWSIGGLGFWASALEQPSPSTSNTSTPAPGPTRQTGAGISDTILRWAPVLGPGVLAAVVMTVHVLRRNRREDIKTNIQKQTDLSAETDDFLDHLQGELDYINDQLVRIRRLRIRTDIEVHRPLRLARGGFCFSNTLQGP